LNRIEQGLDRFVLGHSFFHGGRKISIFNSATPFRHP
jgi:hypothetical protein